MSVTAFSLRSSSRAPRPAPETTTSASATLVAANQSALSGSVVPGAQHYPLSFAEKLSPRQAAKRLGVTLSTVYRLIETERLEASKVGGRWVVYAHAVEILLEQRKNTNS